MALYSVWLLSFLSLPAKDTDWFKVKRGIYLKFLDWGRLSGLKGNCIVRLKGDSSPWNREESAISKGLGNRNSQQNCPGSVADLNQFWPSLWYVQKLGTQLYPALCNTVDCSLPGSSVYGILQAGILEWVAMPFFRGLSDPGIKLMSHYVSCTDRQVLYH